MFMSRIWLPVVLVLTTSFTAFAFASHAGELRVATSDLNLNKAQGMQALHHRIEAAIKEVCSAADGQLIQLQRQYNTCRMAARANAAAQTQALLAANDHERSIVVASGK